MIENIKLKYLFIASITGTFVLSLAVMFFVVKEITNLSSVTESIYKHPFAVSNAVRESKNHITSIHRHMKDVVLSESTDMLEKAVALVEQEEKHIFYDFRLVKKRFLGSHQLVENTTKLIKDWRPIREEVIRLKRNNQNIEAANITRGKGADHVSKIEKSMQSLLDFANNKADEFLRKNEVITSTTFLKTVASLSLLMLISLLINWMIYRVLSRQLNVLSNSTDAIKSGDYSNPVPGIGLNEIGLLAAKFENMRQSISTYIEINRSAKKEADDANREKSRFLANMSHELRTPMHAILSFTSLSLKKIDDKEKLVRFLQNIRTSSLRLTSLLDDLLDLAKLESGKMEPNFIEEDLFTLLEHAQIEVSSLLNDKQITLNINSVQHFECMMDHKLMMQVFINLLSNAIKFSRNNSEISIHIKKSNEILNGTKQDIINISVIDDGIGIPEHELNLVFNKFVQSEKTKSKKGGTGLGLPITKEIIQLHHGEIWAESPPMGRDRGTVFFIKLPVLQGISNLKNIANIEDAIYYHKEYRKVIDEMFANKKIPLEISSSVISNENLCSLGQWINEEQIDSDEFNELVTVHKDFHLLAGECVAYCEMKHFDRALEKRIAFTQVSTRIIELLSQLKPSPEVSVNAR